MRPDERPLAARRRARWVAFLVVLAAAAATVLQTGWMERVKASLSYEGGASFPSMPPHLLLRAARRTVDPLAAFAAAAALFAFLEVVRVSWRQAREPGSGGPAALLPRRAIGLLLLGLPAAWSFVRWHFAPGVVAGADAGLHVSTVALAAQEVSEGRWPQWTDAWYLGFPLLQHSGAAYFLPAAALAVLAGDVRFGAKAALALWHLAAGPGAYLLARETGASRGAAFVAAVAYVACPFFGATLAVAGDLPAAPMIALTPLALAFAIRTARGADGFGSAAGWGLALGFLGWTEPGTALRVAALTVVAAAVTGGRGLLARAFALRAGAAAGLALLVALPFLYAHAFADLPRSAAAPPAAASLTPGVPDVGLLASSMRAWGAGRRSPAGSLSAVSVGLALVGLWLLARRGPTRAWMAVPLVVLLWTGGGTSASRALLLLPAALLPGLSRTLSAAAARAPAFAVVLAAVLSVDLAAGNLYAPYRGDLEGLRAALAEEARTQGEGRTVLLARDERGVLTASQRQVGLEAPLRTLTGGFPEAGPELEEPLLDRAAKDPTLTDDALARDLATRGVTSIRVVERRSLLPADAVVTERLRAAGEAVGPPDPGLRLDVGSIRPRRPSTLRWLFAPALAVAIACAIAWRRRRDQRWSTP